MMQFNLPSVIVNQNMPEEFLNQEEVKFNGYLCVLCYDELKEEKALCDKCLDMMKPLVPAPIRVVNAIPVQTLKMNGTDILNK